MPINTEELLKILACPCCLGDLTALCRNGETAGFACAACQAIYPVIDEIPVLLIEKAVPRAAWDKEYPDAGKD